MDPVATLLEQNFIPDQDAGFQFDSSLWRECFYMLLKLLSSEQLVIEEFSPQVRINDTVARLASPDGDCRNVVPFGALRAIYGVRELLSS